MATGSHAVQKETLAVVFEAILNAIPTQMQELNPQLPAELHTIVPKSVGEGPRLR